MSETQDVQRPSRDRLEQRIAALEEEHSRLRDRIDELERKLDSESSALPAAASDYRDARVLDGLQVGDEPRLSTLQTLYLGRTDIRDDETLRDRIEDLVESPAFETIGYQQWRYLGPKDADGVAASCEDEVED